MINPVEYAKLAGRGRLMIPSDAVLYEGMIMGELNGTKDDVDTGICKKHDGYAKAPPCPDPKIMSLEECLSYIEADECLEVTPSRIAMRKVVLWAKERKLMQRKEKKSM